MSFSISVNYHFQASFNLTTILYTKFRTDNKITQNAMTKLSDLRKPRRPAKIAG